MVNIMSKYSVKYDDLKTKNDYEKDLTKKMIDNVKNMENLIMNLEWSGSAKDKFVTSYKEYIEDLKGILNDITGCNQIAEAFYNNYNDGYNKIQSNLAKRQNEMGSKWKIEK